MLDVAFVMFDFGPTGVVRNTIRIARAAADAGLRIELWVVQDGGPLRGDLPTGIPVRAFGPELGTGYSRAERRKTGRRTVPALTRLIEQQRPTLLLSSGNHFHSFAAAAAGRSEFATRLLLRISTGLPKPDGLNPWRWGRYWFKREKARRRQTKAHKLIAVSEEVGRELVEVMGAPPTQVIVIPNGIDRGTIERNAAQPLDHPWFAEGKPPVLLGVGRLDKFKNFELLIAAFAQLRATRPLRLMILGEERNRWQHRLQTLASELGVSDDVRFEGFVANPHPYFRRAAAYVCCSRYEGMSNAMLEALANGCPVVATTTATGAAEILQDGKVGPLASSDAASLARAIEQRLGEPRNSAGLQDRAGDYDLSATISTYVALLRAESISLPA